MRNYFSILIFSLISSVGFSQEELPTIPQGQNSIHRQAKPGYPSKAIINVVSYENEVVVKFRERLSSPQLSEKIEIVHHDEQNKQLTIVYNEKLKADEFITLFTEYGINCYKKQQ